VRRLRIPERDIDRAVGSPLVWQGIRVGLRPQVEIIGEVARRRPSVSQVHTSLRHQGAESVFELIGQLVLGAVFVGADEELQAWIGLFH
jgi:hypothetical protein